jgi:hypothetical protein
MLQRRLAMTAEQANGLLESMEASEMVSLAAPGGSRTVLVCEEQLAAVDDVNTGLAHGVRS